MRLSKSGFHHDAHIWRFKVKLAKAYVLWWVGHEFVEGKLCHCLVTCYRPLTRADCWGGYRWGWLGLCLVTITPAAPVPSPNIVDYVQPSPARTKLSWLMSRVCQVSQQCATCVQCWILLNINNRAQGWCWCDHWVMAPVTAATACRETAVLQCLSHVSNTKADQCH